MLSFPNIATLYDGMSLGATQLDAYRRGIEFLRQNTIHARMSTWAQPETGGTYVETEIYRWFMYHEYGHIYFRAHVGELAGGHHVLGRLDVSIADVWTQVLTWDVTTDSYTEQTVDVPGGMTTGQFYEYRLVVWSDELCLGTCYPTLLCEVGDDVPPAAWGAMTPFTATTSTAAELNALKTNIEALESAVSKSNALFYTSTVYMSDPAQMFLYGHMIYRPDSLVLGVRTCQTYGFPWYFTFSIKTETPGASWEVKYTSPTYYGRNAAGQERWDYKSATATTTSWGLTAGDKVYWRLQVHNAYKALEGIVAYASRAVVETGWETLRVWSKGDTVVGPTNLNAFQTDLGILYTAYTTALQATQHRACGAGSAWGEPNAKMPHAIAGVHRYPFLYYRVWSEDQRPVLRYGPNADTEQGLSTALETGDTWPHWFMLDLEKLDPKIIPGNVYFLENCVAAIEMSEELSAYA